ncbi:hypothetical protein Mgra_00004553 [Meloidogyne graminicola]|uniref:Probable pectate lyase F n=1 Tax=Meloidogyne graminicola TaxID=189291 RepID=A0A8S9ZR78_9BILA|nr:hypothetical protein Mgra_00004553 [Meloidogyne graminicola]
MKFLLAIILINSFFNLNSFGLNTQGAKFCKFPTPKSTNITTKGFFISGNYDFGMQRIIYNGGSKNTCNKNIQKQWDSVITIQNGGSISNVILGVSPEGISADINCMGSCTLNNVYWENVCWRGASFRVAKGFKKTDKTRYTYTVNGGGALDGFRKFFDQSGPGKTIISNFCSVNNAIGIASCDGNPVDKVTLKNVEIYGENNPTSKITYACSEYMGESVPNPWANSYKPGQAGGKSCNYAANAVKIMT